MYTHVLIFVVTFCVSIILLSATFLWRVRPPRHRARVDMRKRRRTADRKQRGILDVPSQMLAPEEVERIYASAEKSAQDSALGDLALANPHPPRSLQHSIWQLHFRASYRRCTGRKWRGPFANASPAKAGPREI